MDSSAYGRMQNPLYQEASDDDLVEMCRGGDSAAFDELMKRYRIPALKVAVSIIRDKEDAEDEVQNAFFKAYEHIDQFHQDAKFSTWLTRIVVNQCLMRLRRARRAKFSSLDDVPRDEALPAMELRDERKSPEQILGQAQVAEVLKHEIRLTPSLLRNVFVLRDVQQLPMGQVAGVLGISVAAAKSRLLRARVELRNRMRRHYGDTGPATLMR